MNPEEFKKRIVAKYPGGISSAGIRYADMDATDLTQKMVAKYPDGVTNDGIPYADFLKAKNPAMGPAQKALGYLKSAGSFLGDITGITTLGKGLGQAAFALTPEKQELDKLLEQQKITPEKYEEITTGGITPKQVAGAGGKLALTLGTGGTAGVASKVPGVIGVGARATEAGILGATYQALSNLEQEKPAGEGIGTAAAIGAAIPIAGGILKGIKGMIKPAGEEMLNRIIKPLKIDVNDGFNIKNVTKHGLGGSLQTMAKKTDDKLIQLTEELNTKLKAVDSVVDLNGVAERTANKLTAEKMKAFGERGAVKRILENLANEIEEQSANGLVSIPEAQVIKQAAGRKGAWVFGFRDPDSNAIEKVYNSFYHELKEEIEKRAPAGVKEINKQISELIPISNALTRRIPVAERQNVISLTDLIATGISFWNPYALSILGLNRLTKSGTFANILTKIEPKKATTVIGQRIFGQ